MTTAQKPRPILVVEDETIMRESLRDWLTDAGYSVETAEDGEKALSSLTRQEFGFIIVDLRLPKRDGLEVLRQAKAKYSDLKGIVITAYPSVQTALEAMKEGAVDYLPKPCDLNRLEETVRKVLGPVQVEIKRKPGIVKTVAAPAVPESVPEQIRNMTESSSLIQMLLAIQKQNHWLPEEALTWVSHQLGVSMTQIYHIATFYKAFSLKPQGQHEVAVCLGTACHVRGAPRLLDKVVDALQIRPDETTTDLQFSLKTVNCLGCCALGPVMMVDGKYYSNPTSEKIKEIFEAGKQGKEVTV
jgi:NADH-quinone oxidoreductase subunit E